MTDPTSQLRAATRRAKSDVANKLISMFLHELSRRVSQDWPIKVDGEEYERLVREQFGNKCPYCSRDLVLATSVIEHLDGMNRYRTGLHAPGNVLVACKRCNGEKRRDDSLKVLSLADSGWASFLSHDGSHCLESCATCAYWRTVWDDDAERKRRMNENLQRIRVFRATFLYFEQAHKTIIKSLPDFLAKLYADCQSFAEKEIKSLLERLDDGVVPQP